MPDQLSENEAKSGNELLSLMGNALATWQGVEHTIADIYRSDEQKKKWGRAPSLTSATHC